MLVFYSDAKDWASSDVVICLAILTKTPKCLFRQIRIALAKLFNMHQENNKRSCILHAFQRKFREPNSLKWVTFV